MLEHPSTVAASSLDIEDLPTFDHRYVRNKQMFAGCLLEEDNLRKMNEMSNRVEKHMKLYACMMSYPDIKEKCLELQIGSCQIIIAWVCEELDHLSETITVEGKKKIIERVKQDITKQHQQYLENHQQVLTFVIELMGLQILDIKKEV